MRPRVTIDQDRLCYQEDQAGWTPVRWVGAEVVAIDPVADTITLGFRRPAGLHQNTFPRIGTRLDLIEMDRSPYWTLVDD